MARPAGVGHPRPKPDLACCITVSHRPRRALWHQPALVGAAAAALGGIDVLVNNAGVYGYHPVTATSYEDWQAAWRKIIDTNLHGSANVTWCVTDHLMRRPEGPAGARIISVGSRGAYR